MNLAGIHRTSRIWRRARRAWKSRRGGTPRTSFLPRSEFNLTTKETCQQLKHSSATVWYFFSKNHFRATSCLRWLQVSMRKQAWLPWCQEQGWALQKISVNYIFDIYANQHVCCKVQFKPQCVKCCLFRVKQDHEDLQGCLEHKWASWHFIFASFHVLWNHASYIKNKTFLFFC